MTLATYVQSGGGHPTYDEELEIEDDGRFTLTRHVSADRAGRFAGTLSADQLQQVRAALEAVGEPVRITPTRPRTIIEIVEWSGGSASFPLEDDLPDEWEALRQLLQTLVEDLKTDPVSALELRLDDAAGTATFEVLGREPIRIGFDGSSLAVSLFGEDEDFLDSTTVGLPGDLADGDALPPGWKREIALDHGFEFNPERTLQVSVDLTIDGEDAQLLAVAGKGWF